MEKLIFIVIPIHNRLEITKKGLACIFSTINDYKIQNHENSFTVKLIVVDDGSTDGSAEFIEKTYPDTIILRGDGNLWWTGAANLAVEYIMKNYKNTHGIIFQNDDILIEVDWLSKLIQSINYAPNSIIGCATTTLDKRDEITFGGVILHPWFAKTKFKNLGKRRDSFKRGHLEESFYLSGRGLYIPIGVFNEIGLFDQKSFKHRGDVDIPLRAKKKGYSLLVSYDAIVYELPQHTYELDIKKGLTLKEFYKALADFRSSYSINYAYSYSRAATNNPVQFASFFSFLFLYNAKALFVRYINR